MEASTKLEGLFQKAVKIKVPSYQRAYAWEKKQLSQFVSDLLEVANKDKGEYYFGHFILEGEKEFELIDGQQRITTFALFLMVCKLFSENEYSNYIGKFKTVDYDQPIFESIQKKLLDMGKDWSITDFDLQDDNTLSIKRIIFALDYFRKLFVDKKLEVTKIDKYVETLKNAHISTHITQSKAVAVQIFELQNTRGIKLSLIEMVKAILMKAIYLHSESSETENKVNLVRNEFAKIYQLEERVISSSFRGAISLEDILLHHLRMVDDGSKLENKTDNKFHSPSKSGNKEDAILDYIKSQIVEKQPNEIVDYIVNLSEKFRMSVELVSTDLPKYDEKNRLIGDVLILDKIFSLEFFLLLFHLEQSALIQDNEFIRNWEKFLFTRDFHDRYHGLQRKDDFEGLFFRTSQPLLEMNSIQDILMLFITNGFRCDRMDNNNLLQTVANFVARSKDSILNNAFNWFREKIFYVLYKYEISKQADLSMLREIIKDDRSVEHILPQEWQWEWIGENDQANISPEGHEFYKKTGTIINGLGNLLLITGSENSSVSNKHPKNKKYETCNGGSYSEHNNNPDKWENPQDWEKIIIGRGEEIYKFLENFIK